MEDGFDLFSTSYIPAKEVAKVDAKAKAEAEAELARKRFYLGYASIKDWFLIMSALHDHQMFAEYKSYGKSPAVIIHDSIYYADWDFVTEIYPPAAVEWEIEKLTLLGHPPTFVKVPRYRPGTAHFTPFAPEAPKVFSLPLSAEPHWLSLNRKKWQK